MFPALPADHLEPLVNRALLVFVAAELYGRPHRPAVQFRYVAFRGREFEIGAPGLRGGLHRSSCSLPFQGLRPSGEPSGIFFVELPCPPLFRKMCRIRRRMKKYKCTCKNGWLTIETESTEAFREREEMWHAPQSGRHTSVAFGILMQHFENHSHHRSSQNFKNAVPLLVVEKTGA